MASELETHGPRASRRPSSGQAIASATAPWIEPVRWPAWVVLFVAVGVVLRLREYLTNRSVWADESFLAVQLIERSPRELVGALAFNQGAPAGFLVAEKTVGAVAGYSEMALRFLPLVFGALALVVFVPLAQRTIALAGLPLALALVAVADSLVLYVSQIKQYSVDVFAAVAVLAAAVPLARDAPSIQRAVALAAVTVPLVWLSHPALFVTTACGAVIVGNAVLDRSGARLLRVAPAVAIWVLTCLLVVLTLPDYDELRAAQSRQGAAFVGGSDAISDPVWAEAFVRDIVVALGLPGGGTKAPISVVVAAVALIGFFSLLRRDRVAAALLGLPFAVTLVVSAFELYPLYVRTLLFLIPLVALFLAQGTVEIGMLFARRRRPLVVAGLAVFAIAIPAVTAFERFVNPPAGQELRPALEYVRDHWRRGDTLFLSWGDQHAYLYYLRCGCFELANARGTRLPSQVVLLEGVRRENYAAIRSATRSLVIGDYHPNDPEARLADLRRVRGRERVWVVSAHEFHGDTTFRREQLSRHLERIGTRLDAFLGAGGHAYLYDFGR